MIEKDREDLSTEKSAMVYYTAMRHSVHEEWHQAKVEKSIDERRGTQFSDVGDAVCPADFIYNGGVR